MSRYTQDFSPAEKRPNLEWAFSPGIRYASAKAHDWNSNFSGALKRSFPRMNAEAPTLSRVVTLFFNSLGGPQTHLHSLENHRG